MYYEFSWACLYDPLSKSSQVVNYPIYFNIMCILYYINIMCKLFPLPEFLGIVSTRLTFKIFHNL